MPTGLALVVVSFFVGLGRFAIPGHTLSWPGTYEAVAHILVGMLIAFCFVARLRWCAAWCLAALTTLEVAKFMVG